MSKYIKKAFSKLSITPKDKTPRAMDQIQTEYLQHAAELGNIEYQIKTLEVQKGSCISRMSELSLESTMIKPEPPPQEQSNAESNLEHSND